MNIFVSDIEKLKTIFNGSKAFLRDIWWRTFCGHFVELFFIIHGCLSKIFSALSVSIVESLRRHCWGISISPKNFGILCYVNCMITEFLLLRSAAESMLSKYLWFTSQLKSLMRAIWGLTCSVLLSPKLCT